MGDRIRAFIAVPLPEEVFARARELQAQLQAAGLHLRWVKPGAIHLTLKFLGDIDRHRVPEVEGALAAVAAVTDPLVLAAKGLGLFPTIKKARVLWLGIAGETPGLIRLQAQLEQALAPLGFCPEKRRFSAHLTLGRIRGRLDPRRLVRCIEVAGGFDAVPFTGRRITLYRSELNPGGAVYTTLASRDLGPAGL